MGFMANKNPTVSTPSDQKVPLYEKFAFASGDVACNFVFDFTGSLLTFFYTDYAGVPVALVGMIMLISRIFDGGSDIVFACIVDKVHSKYGKARPWVLWMSVPFGISYILLFTVPASATVMMKGIGYGPLWGSIFAMLADVCEFGQWKFHYRNDAFLFSAGSIGSKVGGGIAVGMVGVILSAAGYDGTLAVQTAASLDAIYKVYIFLPIALAVVQVVFCLLYDLDKKLPTIMQDLAEREARGEM